MSPKKAKRANELPYIPLGPFQWRIPGIHYRVEYVEFFQGLILGATALSSIPYLTDNLDFHMNLHGAVSSLKYLCICFMDG